MISVITADAIYLGNVCYWTCVFSNSCIEICLLSQSAFTVINARFVPVSENKVYILYSINPLYCEIMSFQYAADMRDLVDL